MKSVDELKDLRGKDIAQLSKMLHKQKDGLIKATLDHEFGKNKDVAAIGKLKTSIARIETIINESITTQAKEASKARKNG